MDAHLLYQNLAVIAAFLLIYSLIAGRFESKLVNGPLLFLLTGWLLGPGGWSCSPSLSTAPASSCWPS